MEKTTFITLPMEDYVKKHTRRKIFEAALKNFLVYFFQIRKKKSKKLYRVTFGMRAPYNIPISMTIKYILKNMQSVKIV